MVVAGGWGRGEQGAMFNRHVVSIWEGRKVLEMDGGEGGTGI